MRTTRQCFVGTTAEVLLLFPNFQSPEGAQFADSASVLSDGSFNWHTAGVWPVLVVVVVVLVAVAAVFDWRARRRGQVHRTQPDYWRAVTDARREERYAHTTRYFSRFLPKRPT